MMKWLSLSGAIADLISFRSTLIALYKRCQRAINLESLVYLDIVLMFELKFMRWNINLICD